MIDKNAVMYVNNVKILIPPELAGKKYQVLRCPECGKKSIIAWDDSRGHQQVKCIHCKNISIYNMDELRWRRLRQYHYENVIIR